MKGAGEEIAKMVGPPDKLGKGPPKKDEGDAEDPEEASESDEDEAAELSVAEEYQSAVKDGTPADVLRTFKQMVDTCKY